MKQVSRNVFVETGFQGCIVSFVVTSDGLVMVDTPQRPTDAVKWREEVTSRGEVCYLINTEPHADHVTGNSFFKGTVVAHRGTREAFTPALKEQILQRIPPMDPEAGPLLARYELNPPTVTFSQELTLHTRSHTFHLTNLPGHTPSQTAIYCPEERVVFTGDNVVYRTGPFFHQAMPLSWLRSLKKLQALDVDTVVPGHGDVCPKSYILEMAKEVRFCVNAVRKAIRDGMSEQEAMAKISFIDRYPPAPNPQAQAARREMMKTAVQRLYQALTGKVPA